MFNLYYKGVSQSPQCCRTRPEHSLCGSFTNRKLLVQLGSHHDFTYVSMCPQKAVNHRLKWPSISTLGLRPSLSVKPRTSSVSRQPIDRPSSRPQTQRDLAWMTLRIHLETESKNLPTLEMSESPKPIERTSACCRLSTSKPHLSKSWHPHHGPVRQDRLQLLGSQFTTGAPRLVVEVQGQQYLVRNTST